MPVLSRYHEPLLAAARFAGTGLICCGADPGRRNLTNPLIRALDGGGGLPRLDTSRLRATWLADCADLLGLATFMRAAGISCSQRLGDLVAGLEPGGEAEAVRLLGTARRDMDVYGGIDWAEDHHDIALVDRDGKLRARRRISDDRPAWRRGWTCSPITGTPGTRPGGDPDPAAGVACLRATGRPVTRSTRGGGATGPERGVGEEIRPRRLGVLAPRCAPTWPAPAATRRL